MALLSMEMFHNLLIKIMAPLPIWINLLGLLLLLVFVSYSCWRLFQRHIEDKKEERDS